MKKQTMQIRRQRQRAGMHVRELASMMGVYTQVIRAWETETYLPKARELPRLAAALGCSVDDLYISAEEVRSC